MSILTLEGLEIDVTPAQIAEAFWNLDSSQQCEFFAALHRTAGVQLCFQMAGVVYDMRALADAGKYDAISGFRTMLDHAQELYETMTDIRCNEARMAISKMVDLAHARIGA